MNLFRKSAVALVVAAGLVASGCSESTSKDSSALDDGAEALGSQGNDVGGDAPVIATPVTPSNPATPVTPATPTTPVVPVSPAAPVTPQTPPVVVVPDVPSTPVDQPSQPAPDQNPVQEPVVEQPVPEPVEQPVQPVSDQSPVQEPVVEQPVPQPVEQPVQPVPDQSPVQEPVVEQPVPEPVEQPVQPVPDQNPMQEPVAQPEQPTPGIEPAPAEVPNDPEPVPNTGNNGFDAPADDIVVDFSPNEEASVPPQAAPEAPLSDPRDAPPSISTGVDLSGGEDLSGGQDDSIVRSESLSLRGPSTKDASRGAGPPSTPTGLTRLLAAENWVEFTWAPSVDDQSVSAYEIYRDNELIATVRGDTNYEHDYRSWLSTSYIDCNYTRYTYCGDPQNQQPADGASYAYSVAAVDNEGMRSERSASVVMKMATPSSSSVDLSGYRKIFGEDFDGTELDRSRWKTSLPWGPDVIINQEEQYFVNLFGSDNQVTYDPFVFTGETLQITGINTPAGQLAAANGQPYLSGVLTTADYFDFTYGYVEMRAKFAGGDGMLSTFFLFNQDYYRNKPEIDIIEYLGSRPDKAYQTYHYYDSNRARSGQGEKHSSPTMETVTSQNLSDDFHTYGVLWEPNLVVWYIDGQEVRRLEGPRVSNEPMNIVTQLVMGSEWIGEPDGAKIPAVLDIDYVNVWQK